MTPVTNNGGNGQPSPSPLIQGYNVDDNMRSRFQSIFNGLPISKQNEIENQDRLSQRRGSNVSAHLPQLQNSSAAANLLRQTSKQYSKTDSRVLQAQNSQVSNGNNKAKMAMPIVLTKNGSPQSQVVTPKS